MGFLIGFVIPIFPAFCVETVPMRLRGKAMVMINTLFSMGLIAGNLLAYFCLDDLTHGDWRLMIAICSLFPFVVWFCAWKYMYESARFELTVGRIDDGIKILTEVGKFNYGDRFENFTEKQMEVIKNWANNQKTQAESDMQRFMHIFDVKHRRITICLWILWFGSNFVYYGMVCILPFFLSHYDTSNNNAHSKDGILKLIVTTIGETSAVIPTLALIDNKNFGRRQTIAWSLLVTFLLCIFAYNSSYGSVFLIPCLTMGRFFLKICMAASLSFTAELYSTYYRTIGIGFATTLGKIGACIMPIICINMYYMNNFAPFLLFGLLSFVAAVATRLVPYDTQGRYLDVTNKKLLEDAEMHDLKRTYTSF